MRAVNDEPDHQSNQHRRPKTTPPRVHPAQQLGTSPDQQECCRCDVGTNADGFYHVTDPSDERCDSEDPQPQDCPLRDDNATRAPIAPNQSVRRFSLLENGSSLGHRGARVRQQPTLAPYCAHAQFRQWNAQRCAAASGFSRLLDRVARREGFPIGPARSGRGVARSRIRPVGRAQCCGQKGVPLRPPHTAASPMRRSGLLGSGTPPPGPMTYWKSGCTCHQG